MREYLRYLCILMLTCLPLLAYTARGFFASADVVSPEGDDADPGSSKGLAETKQRIQGDKPLADKLGEIVPERASGSIPKDIPPGETKSLNAVVEKLRAVQPAYDLVRKVERLHLGESSWLDHKGAAEREKWKKDAEAQRKQIQDFVNAEERTLGNVAGAREVFALLRDRVSEVDAEIEILDAFLKYIDLWSKKDYRGSVKVLAGISTDGIRNPEKAKKINDLVESNKKLAVFIADFFDLVELARNLQVVPDELETKKVQSAIDQCNTGGNAIASFLKKYARPPVESCEPHHEWVKGEQERLEKRLAALGAIQRAMAEVTGDIGRLGEARNLPELRTLAAAIAKKTQTLVRSGIGEESLESRIKQLVRTAIETWLTGRAFPRKGPAERLAELKRDQFGTNQEAVVNNQERLIGEFAPPGQGLAVWYYHPWRRARVGPGKPILPFKDGHEPATPKYVQWAEYYNRTSEELSKKRAAKEEWLAFLNRCKELQETLELYRSHVVVSEKTGRTTFWSAEAEPDNWFADWTFVPDENVLPHRDFSDLSEQLTELQRTFGQ